MPDSTIVFDMAAGTYIMENVDEGVTLQSLVISSAVSDSMTFVAT